MAIARLLKMLLLFVYLNDLDTVLLLFGLPNDLEFYIILYNLTLLGMSLESRMKVFIFIYDDDLVSRVCMQAE